MTTPKNPEDAALAKFVTEIKPALIAGETQKVTDVIKQNPAYGSHPEIQAGTTAWTAAAETVDQTAQKIKAMHLALTALIATLPPQVAAWKRASHSIVALINNACGGSAQAIQGWGFPLSTRAVAAPLTTPPGNLRVVYDKALTMTVRWAGVPGHIGYLLQIGDGTPTGWGAVIPCSRAKYLPQGLTPGQKLALRVAVQRKSGVSAWSDALSVTAR